MATEIELKYSVLTSKEQQSSEQIKSIISQLFLAHNIIFTEQEKQLSNHYFDTPDITLSKNKMALRTRGTKCTGEARCFEQTIKTSGSIVAGLHQRPEYNVDIQDSLPVLALFSKDIFPKKLDVSLLQSQIFELFSTHFTRHIWLVSIGGAQIELAFDYGEVACENFLKKIPIYEIELELVSGKTEGLLVLTKLLFSQLALRAGQLTKAARGYSLYHESIALPSVTDTSSLTDLEQDMLPIIELSKEDSLADAFSYGVAFALNKLQVDIDCYAQDPTLMALSKISEQLILLRQGFWLFDQLLTSVDKALRDELSYFIRTIHWVENARYIESLINKQVRYQKESPVKKELITKLQLRQSRYPETSQMLALLHSERFNNLQIDILAHLLHKHQAKVTIDNDLSLIEFSARQLTYNHDLLHNELSRLKENKPQMTIECYLTVHSLVIRALFTTSWFGCLFNNELDDVVNKFNMSWFDIKQGIVELQSLHVLAQQLVHLPEEETKLMKWLLNKSENLMTALNQSRDITLTMKPYWLSI